MESVPASLIGFSSAKLRSTAATPTIGIKQSSAVQAGATNVNRLAASRRVEHFNGGSTSMAGRFVASQSNRPLLMRKSAPTGTANEKATVIETASDQSVATNLSPLAIQLSQSDASVDDGGIDSGQLAARRRRKKKDEGVKGLRFFALKVCEKLMNRARCQYNAVAEELVSENFVPPEGETPARIAVEQKNVRRRVYDSLNVLMALQIVRRERRHIRWVGFPRSLQEAGMSVDDCRVERQRRIRQKRADVVELLLGIIGARQLIDRNRSEQGKRPAADVLTSVGIKDVDELLDYVRSHGAPPSADDVDGSAAKQHLGTLKTEHLAHVVSATALESEPKMTPLMTAVSQVTSASESIDPIGQIELFLRSGEPNSGTTNASEHVSVEQLFSLQRDMYTTEGQDSGDSAEAELRQRLQDHDEAERRKSVAILLEEHERSGFQTNVGQTPPTQARPTQDTRPSNYSNPEMAGRVYTPLLVVVAPMDTVIDCCIAQDETDYQLKMTAPFKIYDELDLLKRMPLAVRLEGGALRDDADVEELDSYLPLDARQLMHRLICDQAARSSDANSPSQDSSEQSDDGESDFDCKTEPALPPPPPSATAKLQPRIYHSQLTAMAASAAPTARRLPVATPSSSAVGAARTYSAVGMANAKKRATLAAGIARAPRPAFTRTPTATVARAPIAAFTRSPNTAAARAPTMTVARAPTAPTSVTKSARVVKAPGTSIPTRGPSTTSGGSVTKISIPVILPGSGSSGSGSGTGAPQQKSIPLIIRNA